MAIAAYAAPIPLAFFSVKLVWICFVVLRLLFIVPVTRQPRGKESAANEPQTSN